jgi:hypothetical protein
MRPVLVRVQPPQPTFPSERKGLPSLARAVYPACTSLDGISFPSFWTAPRREKCFFFCQIEALETVIYLAEVVSKYGDVWIENTVG